MFEEAGLKRDLKGNMWWVPLGLHSVCACVMLACGCCHRECGCLPSCPTFSWRPDMKTRISCERSGFPTQWGGRWETVSTSCSLKPVCRELFQIISFMCQKLDRNLPKCEYCPRQTYMTSTPTTVMLKESSMQSILKCGQPCWEKIFDIIKSLSYGKMLKEHYGQNIGRKVLLRFIRTWFIFIFYILYFYWFSCPLFWYLLYLAV